MRYEIFGETMPAVTVYLQPGESMITQSGGMSWMPKRHVIIFVMLAG